MATGPQEARRRPELRPQRGPGLPARLRSLFAVPSWGRKPEPRVRYGEVFLPGLGALGRQHVHAARTLLERAEAVRGRRFTYLGRTVGFPGRIDWNPRGLSERWRVALNSLDDLMSLGVAAAISPTPQIRQGWFEVSAGLIREWIDGAPLEEGVAWQLPALARRIPNLIHAHVFFAPELRADIEARSALLASLYAQATALAAAVPAHPAEPALIGAGRALFMAGRFFDGMEARGWLQDGAALLWTQLREQVNEDGGHRGRSPLEHALALADYLEVTALLASANDDVPLWARKRLKGMADFFTRLVHPDGELPLFHGTALGIARPARELLAVAAVLLREPGIAPPGELPGIWPLLVLAEAGRRVHTQLPRRQPGEEPRALRRTGFYVLPGDPGDVMLLDGGSPPPGGDGSAFGYELSMGGLRLIVDAGVGSEEPSPWPVYFRSTAAHNVVSVAGMDQVAAGRMPVVSDVQWVVRDGLLYYGGTHDGFARLARDLRLRHRRHVFCLPGRFWLVCDEVLGTEGWEAESFVHFHPETELTAVCDGHPAFLASRAAGAWVRVVPFGAAETRILHGAIEPSPNGWYAPRHGERHAAPVLSLVTAGRLPLVFGYALLPRSREAAAVRFEHDAFHLRLALAVGRQEYRLSVVQGDVELAIRPLE